VDALRILISGAGIAGPTLAYWLDRYGCSVAVVERAPAPRPGGQAVDLRGAGRIVIERMGLLPQARELSLDQQGIAFVDADDRPKALMTTEHFGGEGIVSDLEILRGDLGALLHRATSDRVEYVFDDTITSIAQDEDGVDVDFASAAPRRFDLVVGADGLHSVVRRLIFGDAAMSPLGAYIAWFTAPTHRDLDGWYRMYNAPGGRVASMRPGRLPGEIKASLSFRSTDLSYDRRDVNQQQALLRRRFAGLGWDVPQLLDAAQAAPDFVFDAMGQVHLDRWSRGRAVLIGDAGYCPTPLTGLGTSLALVGAYLLAGELAAAGGDHRAGFAGYERALRPYVTKGQELPPGGVRGYAPNGPVAIRLRTASMRWMDRWPIRPILARQFAKAGDVTLPDYDPVLR
jgi:2-polyprenyl-6-methoxyphenol hydroxylase-like FAD-dependent oxidoreductase